MGSSNYRFTLDMQSNQSQVSLPVRLGDTNRRLYVILTNSGTPFILERGFRAVLYGRKADGKTLTNDCIIESETTIRYDFTENTASAPGVVDCEMRVYDAEGELVTSPRFILVVDDRVLYDEEIVSGSERSALDRVFGSETAREAAEVARKTAETARASAEVTREEAERSRKTAESSRAFAEESRVGAENYRDSSERQRELAEDRRGEAEVVRGENEQARKTAELEREKAFGTVRAVFNTVTGDNKVHRFDSPDSIISYIVSNSSNLTAGDVLLITDNEFDFFYMGRANEAEKTEAEAEGRFYNLSSLLFGVTWEAGKLYVIEGGGADFHKCLATTEKYKLPIGQDELAERLAEIKESASNAIKGKATGGVVRVDDVSPIEHRVKCKVRSKNLFNNLLDYRLATDASYTYENGVLTVEGQYANKHIDVADGETYTFSCKSTRTGTAGGGIYLRAYTTDLITYVNLFSAISELSQTATVTVPKGYPVLRVSFYGDSSGGTGTATYTEIMLEKGSTKTKYVPYVDTTNVTVSRFGKNLLDLTRATFTSATYNKNVNGISCKISNGYYSGARVDYLNAFLLANKGKTLTFSIGEAIDGALISLLIYGTRTSGKTNQEGSATGKREISFQISEEFTAITGLEVRVNRQTTAFTDTTTIVRNMQVEVSEKATDFEEYKAATTHTLSADGTVEGVKSLSPAMTILTDTADVVIGVEYNQDINTLNKKLAEALNAIIEIQKTLIGGTTNE